ncbi:aquaporin [Ruania suaedae]|uniref:MIP/aquaporin family protein n=1 Tax=Ruania suaedae TaxID=2897774 RepID=UPI001E4927A5|nr:MIP/aquaporin family protein [Ruania suaedae]UFU03883.1 aquaporin [Ruania suaedae]
MSAPEYTPELAPRQRLLLPRFGAEVLGTFVLVLIGFGATLYAGVTATPDDGAKLLAWAAGLIAAVAVIGHISGGHLNPAVTLGAAITGRISWADLLPYWVAQLIGGVGAAALLFITVPAGLPAATGQGSTRTLFTPLTSGLGESSVLGRLSNGAVGTELVPTLLIEAVATAVFVAIALAAGRYLRRGAIGGAVVIGLSYAGLTVSTYTLTGGALNPARASAAAIFAESGALGDLWLFWLAPLLGGALAAMLFTVFAPEPLPAAGEWEDEDDDDEDADEVVVIDSEDDARQDEDVDLSEEPVREEYEAPVIEEKPAEGEDHTRDDSFTEDFDVATLEDSDLAGTTEQGSPRDDVDGSKDEDGSGDQAGSGNQDGDQQRS